MYGFQTKRCFASNARDGSAGDRHNTTVRALEQLLNNHLAQLRALQHQQTLELRRLLASFNLHSENSSSPDRGVLARRSSAPTTPAHAPAAGGDPRTGTGAETRGGAFLSSGELETEILAANEEMAAAFGTTVDRLESGPIAGTGARPTTVSGPNNDIGDIWSRSAHGAFSRAPLPVLIDPALRVPLPSQSPPTKHSPSSVFPRRHVSECDNDVEEANAELAEVFGGNLGKGGPG